MSLIKRILKEYEQVSPTEIRLSTKDTLFHATVEDFSADKLDTGGYDNVLWTTDSSLIASTYIPVSGSMSYTHTDMFIKPSRSGHSENMQKQLGIEFKNVEFQHNQPVSWSRPKVFSFKKEHEHNEKLFEKVKELTSQIQTTDDYDKKKELRSQYEEINKQFHDIDKLKREYVNNKLKALGYSPSREDDYSLNHRWEIKTSGSGDIYPANYRAEGRLFILKPKTTLRIFDLTRGGEVEGDMTDLDYHKHNIFQIAEEKGYDGVKINDFAQTEGEGNVGHTSIGLFKDTIKKMNVFDIIKAYHPEPEDFRNRVWELRTSKSKEYEEYLNYK